MNLIADALSDKLTEIISRWMVAWFSSRGMWWSNQWSTKLIQVLIHTHTHTQLTHLTGKHKPARVNITCKHSISQCISHHLI